MQLGSSRFLRYIILCSLFLCFFLGTLFYRFCLTDFCSLPKFNSLIAGNSTVPVRRRLVASKVQQDSAGEDPDDGKSIQAPTREISYDKLSVGLSSFNIKGTDVIVFLHVQNTGGSVFARHMIEDLNLERPCRCKANRRICQCYRPNNYGSPWFFSRYTTGWKCGVHPDWLELSNCIDRAMDEEEGKPVKRRYFFVTMLRDPVKRFLSEFWHLGRGQNGLLSRHWCSDNEASTPDLPPCFSDSHLRDLDIEEFVSCPYNLAVNRQTRMLSDLSLVGCYNSTLQHDDRDLIMLTSAKANLHKMSFFGLTEFPKVSQYVFEATFGLNFKRRQEPRRGHLIKSPRKQLFKEITANKLQKIKQTNHLDVELYKYAKELLFYRFEKLKKIDPLFNRNFNIVSDEDLSTENWAEKEDFMSFLANEFD